MIGQEFGALVVESQAGVGTGGVSWWCRCKLCEKVVKRTTFMLNNDSLKSCGCNVKHHPNVIQPPKELKRAHRLTFVSWKAMLARCYYSKNKHNYYKNVKVCDRWFDFRNFLEDMGDRPSLDHSIDRRVPTLGYHKKNCQWVLKTINCSRIRVNRDPEMLRRRGQTHRERRAAGMYAPLSEKSRRGIAAGALKRIGRTLQTCTKCGGRSYVGPVCKKCGKRVSVA